MGRQVGIRLELRGKLRVVSALSVGTGDEERGVDLAVARDGQGRPYVPGTSLAGALRAWTAPAPGSSGAESWELLWGRGPRADGAEGWASRVVVEDGLVHLPGGLTFEEVRDGVGIDRCTGAARSGVKYERAVLPVGSLVELALVCDVPSAEAAAGEDLLQNLRLALRGRRVRLGAGRSRGLGVVELMPASDVLTGEALHGREEILDALVRRVRPESRPLAAIPPPTTGATPSSSRLTMAVEWRPLGPLMVRAGTDGLAVDSLPLTSHVDGGRALLLPGSALKGMLRSHAERILRTLEIGGARGQGFQEQIECHPLVAWLFGSAPASKERDAPGRLRPGLAAIWVDDCLSRDPIPAEEWQEVEVARRLSSADRQDDAGRSAADRTVREALDASDVLRAWDPAVHVALDRWTGGAADQRLYSVLEPHGVRWHPIVLTMDFGRIEQELWPQAVALLLLVVDDLARGLLPIGYATNRGMGDVAADGLEVAVEAGSAEAVEAAWEFAWLAGTYTVTTGAGILGLLDQERLTDLCRSWSSWLDAQMALVGEAQGSGEVRG